MTVRLSPSLFLVGALAVVLASPHPAFAHFLWLLRHNDAPSDRLEVYFGENAEADDPELLDRLTSAEAWQVTPDGAKPLELTRSGDSLAAKLTGVPASALLVARHNWGVLDRGDAPFLLHYSAKTGPDLNDSAWRRVDCGQQLPLDVIPDRVDGKLQLTVLWQGQPVEGAQVIANGPALTQEEAVTGKEGRVSFPLEKDGLYEIRARRIQDVAGELDGKSYQATRHYTTLTFRVGSGDVATSSADSSSAAKGGAARGSAFPDLPAAVTSFGAAIVGDWVFIYGGHLGEAHEYCRDSQARTLLRLNLKQPEQWEAVGEGPGLQGLALVGYQNKVYRLGGFEAKNDEGEPHDLHSLAEVVGYDAKSGKPTQLPPLPEPRSSFDAAVLEGKLYVIGGWKLQGLEESHWHRTAHVLDLNAEQPKWEALPEPPFIRRALSVAAHDGRIYAIGGMQQEGGPTTRVDVYDPASQSWSQGPSLKGQGMTGFGSAAFALDGRLYVSTLDGTLQRLSSDGQSWEVVRKLEQSRFFHRMIPWNHHLLMIGGADMSVGKFTDVKAVAVEGS